MFTSQHLHNVSTFFAAHLWVIFKTMLCKLSIIFFRDNRNTIQSFFTGLIKVCFKLLLVKIHRSVTFHTAFDTFCWAATGLCLANKGILNTCVSYNFHQKGNTNLVYLCTPNERELHCVLVIKGALLTISHMSSLEEFSIGELQRLVLLLIICPDTMRREYFSHMTTLTSGWWCQVKEQGRRFLKAVTLSV